MPDLQTESQKIEIDQLNRKIRRNLKMNRKIDNLVFIVMILLLAYIGSTIYDNMNMTRYGDELVKYHDFDELKKQNPDICAWIKMDGTHIDHPVVQGKDNFEYLDKDFNGDHYAGGTVFLDYENNPDFSDNYNVIHGHHMTGGAMFGDLVKYKKQEFFNKYKMGKLLTPKYDYKLKVVGVAKVNAYDDRIYNVKAMSKNVLTYASGISIHHREAELKDGEKILTLSTCSGDMNEDRIIVFCKMYGKQKHE